jgi:hypothetical protein
MNENKFRKRLFNECLDNLAKKTHINAAKTVEPVARADNRDYTTTLERELRRIFALETDSFIRNNLTEVATCLNSVVKAQQKCGRPKC